VGASSTGTVSVTVPGATALGTYFLLACADDTGTQAESNEGNNCRASATTVQVQAGGGLPDLVVTALSNPPATAPVGGIFSVTETTMNQGGSATTVITKTRYYLSTDTTKSSGDFRLRGAHSVPPLAAGASHTKTRNVTIRSSTAPGVYFLLACADDRQVVAESNEANQCRASTTTITVTP
jgi:subtilase family serine protease